MNRKIPLGRRSLTGVLPCRPGLGTVELPYESRLERDALMLLQFDHRVEALATQPFTIEYEVSGRLRQYTPDIQATWMRAEVSPFGHRVMVFEVKPQAQLVRNITALKEKTEEIQRFVRQRGWGFRYLTEIDIRIPRLVNAEALLPHWDVPPADDVQGTIVSAIREVRSIRINELEKIVAARHSGPYSISASALKYMIVHRWFQVDLDQPIGPETAIRYWINEPRQKGNCQLSARHPHKDAGSIWTN